VKPDLLLLIVTILVALIFDFLNGFHDAANSIATVVSTRVLSPKLAVLWAAFFNFAAAFLLGTAVAKTIGGGMIHVETVTQYVVITGLFGAIVWDLLTWWFGIPSSTSHTLLGGLTGAVVAHAGFGALHMKKLEEIATSKRGIEKAFAIQAGREIRVLAKADELDDAACSQVAREIAKQIEEELSYPGEVRVTLIREARFIEYAR